MNIYQVLIYSKEYSFICLSNFPIFTPFLIPPYGREISVLLIKF